MPSQPTVSAPAAVVAAARGVATIPPSFQTVTLTFLPDELEEVECRTDQAAEPRALDAELGRDPLDIEVLWQRMYNLTRDYGRKGSVIAAISAIAV